MKSSHYITQHRHARTHRQAGRQAGARAHTRSCADNQLAAANPEIKASVTDVISGCICGREKESRTNACGAAKVHRKMLPSGGKGGERLGGRGGGQPTRNKWHAPSAGCMVSGQSESREKLTDRSAKKALD